MYDCILKLADTVRLMKRLFTILAIVTLLPSIAFAQVKKADAPERDGYEGVPLYGDIESITVREYLLEDKFGKEGKGEMTDWIKYTFNQRGDVIEEASYNSDGSLDLKYLYKYDSLGNRIERASYYSDGILDWKDLYKYDSLGNRIERASYYSDGSLRCKDFYKYDSAGNMIEKAFLNSNGRLISKNLYQYDSAGNMIERTEYNSDGIQNYKVLCKYDSTGNIVKRASYKSEIMIPERLIEYEIVYRE